LFVHARGEITSYGAFFFFRKTGLTQFFTTGREEAVSFKDETKSINGRTASTEGDVKQKFTMTSFHAIAKYSAEPKGTMAEKATSETDLSK